MSKQAASLAVTALRPILPYLHYLPTPCLTLPHSLFLHYTATSTYSPWSLYKSTAAHLDPAHPTLMLLGPIIAFLYIVGLATRNVSQVDRVWTFLPVLFSASFALFPVLNARGAETYGHNLPRLGLMLGLQVLWMIRLTFNTGRRGFFAFAEQDYRYTYIKQQLPTWAFQLIHLFAVAISQTTLLYAMSLPLHSLLITPPAELKPSSYGMPSIFDSTGTPVLTVSDAILTTLTLICLYTQWTADNQHYSYQELKHAKDRSNKTHAHTDPLTGLQTVHTPADLSRGFMTKGLWAYSRHPNFACEQTFWLLQGLFVVLGTSPSVRTKSAMFLHPLIPSWALIMLFTGSTTLTEFITGRKYPAYSSYQARVGQFLPQATFWRYLFTTIRGTRKQLDNEVWGSGGKAGKSQ